MKWDICLFYNELDLLELRIQELWNSVDRFGIIEMPLTFSGLNKPLFLSENWSRFEKYSSRISRIIAAYPPDHPVDPNNPSYNCWMREHYQRSFQGCFPFSDDDIITVCDVDEIPHPMAYEVFEPKNGIGTLKQMFFHYWIDTPIYGSTHDWPKICTGKKLREFGPGVIRHAGFKNDLAPQIISPGGWHFSYLGDVDFIKNKLQSFSHCYDETTKVMLDDDDAYRWHDVKKRKIRKVDITADWPKSMLSNMDFWGKHLCDRSTVTF